VTQTSPKRWKLYGAGVGLLAAGLLSGGILAGTMTANAADSTATSSSTSPSGTDQGKPQRPDETLLTGTTAEKVTAAALAKYPGATVERVETDSEGVYEAHIRTTEGERVTVQIGADFTVTGVQTGGPGHDRAEDPATPD
jgi:hypothetical protein